MVKVTCDRCGSDMKHEQFAKLLVRLTKPDDEDVGGMIQSTLDMCDSCYAELGPQLADLFKKPRPW